MEQTKLTASLPKRLTFSQLVDRELPLFNVSMKTESAGGAKGAALGSSFESLILVSNRGYENKGLGVVKKNHVQKQFVGGRFFHTSKSTVDFDGYCVDVGFVAFDCKTTNEKVWRPERQRLWQFLYLYRGQKELDHTQGRFFYLIERRWTEDRSGTLSRKHAVYLAENLEDIKQTGKYEFQDEDLVSNGPGILLDYRAKLLERK
jgi:penicillin-binding protein-related factor A (putative recombinase)